MARWAGSSGRSSPRSGRGPTRWPGGCCRRRPAASRRPDAPRRRGSTRPVPRPGRSPAGWRPRWCGCVVTDPRGFPEGLVTWCLPRRTARPACYLGMLDRPEDLVISSSPVGDVWSVWLRKASHPVGAVDHGDIRLSVWACAPLNGGPAAPRWGAFLMRSTSGLVPWARYALSGSCVWPVAGCGAGGSGMSRSL